MGRHSTAVMFVIKHLKTVVSVILFAVLEISAPAIAVQSPDSIVAIVNGKELRRVHFDRVMDQILPLASFHGGISPEVRAKNINKAMEKLVEDELLCQEAERRGLKADPVFVDEKLKEAVNRVGGEDNFDKALKYYGISRKEYERMIVKPVLVKQVLEITESKGSEVSDDEARGYYERNKDGHFKIDRRRFRHIIIKTDPGDPSTWQQAYEKAEEIMKRIDSGEKFEVLAKEYSEGPRRESGGDTGLMDRSQLLPELARIGWQLKEGEVSGIIRSIYGYHILKLEEAPPASALPYDEAREQIITTLVGMKKQKLRDSLIERLKANAKIKVLIDE